MTQKNATQLESQIKSLKLPFAAELTFGETANVKLQDDLNVLNISFPFACAQQYPAVQELLRGFFDAQGVSIPEITLAQSVEKAPSVNSQAVVSTVKNIIAVASGKGGVGKSTTSANVAVALAAQGAKVGLLDADIYGPSQHHMFGIAGKRPDMASEGKMAPINAHGVGVISMGNLVTKQTPMVWRGPMVSGALQQLVNNAAWGNLDYLIVDMPPGTGDIQLTLSQSVPVCGAVIVTTPQDIALLDAIKGIEMFQKVSVPILGVVENMATHVCSECGHEEAIFGQGGGDILARDYSAPLLGQLPLSKDIRMQTDAGVTAVTGDLTTSTAQAYLHIALKTAIAVWRQSQQQGVIGSVTVDD